MARTRGASACRSPVAAASRLPGTLGTTATRRPVARSANPATIASAPRQPRTDPTSTPSGTPSTVEMENPAMTMATARPARSFATTAVAVVKAAARKRPCSAPAISRVATNHPKFGSSAGATTRTANRIIAATRTGRRSHRIVAAVSSGPPRASPRAYALNSEPAAETETPRPDEICSSRPAVSSSAEPVTKVPSSKLISTTPPCRPRPRSVEGVMKVRPGGR